MSRTQTGCPEHRRGVQNTDGVSRTPTALTMADRTAHTEKTQVTGLAGLSDDWWSGWCVKAFKADNQTKGYSTRPWLFEHRTGSSNHWVVVTMSCPSSAAPIRPLTLTDQSAGRAVLGPALLSSYKRGKPSARNKLKTWIRCGPSRLGVNWARDGFTDSVWWSPLKRFAQTKARTTNMKWQRARRRYVSSAGARVRLCVHVWVFVWLGDT